MGWSLYLPELPPGFHLLKAEPEAAVGRTLKIKGESHEVVGVVDADTSFVTTGDALALSGANNMGRIVAEARSSGSVSEAEEEIKAALRGAHRAEDFTIMTEKDLLATFTRTRARTRARLDFLNWFIPVVFLGIVGFGVMNSMYSSVTERTKDIAISKTLGATDSDVRSQFVFEALLLTVIGGLAGIGVGVVVSAQLLPELYPNIPTKVTLASTAWAFGSSAATGSSSGSSRPTARRARTPAKSWEGSERLQTMVRCDPGMPFQRLRFAERENRGRYNSRALL
jgi:putative ABC transport system permease protein